jgi:4-azaleucine resistance transporter AzlC
MLGFPSSLTGSDVMPDSSTPYQAFHQGAFAVVPLSLACAPWGLLVGSLAINAHMTPLESQGFSVIVFAGAAQLVAIGMIKNGASIISILLTTLLLTSQHLLYAMHMRPSIAGLPSRWRLSLGFLMTDEFFALNSHQHPDTFNRWYALGVGLTFYVVWNLFTFAGIILAKSIPDLQSLGLEFSIAATFIALVTPLVRSIPVLLCVAVSLASSVLLTALGWHSALIISGLAGMTSGFLAKQVLERKS